MEKRYVAGVDRSSCYLVVAEKEDIVIDVQSENNKNNKNL